MTFRQTGYDAQASMRGLTEEQADLIAGHPDVVDLGRSIVLGLAENQQLTGQSVEIRWANDTYAQHSYAAPTTGQMPQAADEIALDTSILDRLGIPHELGQTVTLEWRKDLNAEEVTTSTFTLCGFWEGNQSSYSSMAWVSRAYADEMTGGVISTDESQVLGLYMVQVNLASDQNIEAAMDRILADTGLTGLTYNVNLAYSPEMGAMAAQESMPMVLGMVLVFIAGYLIIYNIFQISVTADVQFYGKLKTLGTTTKQLKKLIYGQANRLCIIGIPIGLILGWLLGSVLVPVLMGTIEGEAVVSASPIIFLGSAVFAWVTVLISCLRPARLAGKVSPIEALRMSDADSSSKKKTKRRRGNASLASMAWANLWRNKKRTITVICSLTLGLVLLSSFYAQNAAFDMDKYLADLILSDFELSDATSEDYINHYDPHGATLTDSLVAQAEGQEGVEATGHPCIRRRSTGRWTRAHCKMWRPSTPRTNWPIGRPTTPPVPSSFGMFWRPEMALPSCTAWTASRWMLSPRSSMCWKAALTPPNLPAGTMYWRWAPAWNWVQSTRCCRPPLRAAPWN